MENITGIEIGIVALIMQVSAIIIIILIPTLIIKGIIKMIMRIKHKNKMEQIRLENRLKKREENNMKKVS